ncbi:hypothetical protein [Chromatium okenii]|uniref:hypothetical protein n=1 Tax=Chromatium okenii TaxID=61644 RepID=UPI0026EC6282|nr:hypothetical protein [Chromatium okenii]MBV5310170.1 hypothetical protein [Chromatium okenii]
MNAKNKSVQNTVQFYLSVSWYALLANCVTSIGITISMTQHLIGRIELFWAIVTAMSRYDCPLATDCSANVVESAPFTTRISAVFDPDYPVVS